MNAPIATGKRNNQIILDLVSHCPHRWEVRAVFVSKAEKTLLICGCIAPLLGRNILGKLIDRIVVPSTLVISNRWWIVFHTAQLTWMHYLTSVYQLQRMWNRQIACPEFSIINTMIFCSSIKWLPDCTCCNTEAIESLLELLTISEGPCCV